MLTFKLNNKPTNIQQKFVTAEKSPISQSHKSYKIPLTKMPEKNSAKQETV